MLKTIIICNNKVFGIPFDLVSMFSKHSYSKFIRTCRVS